MSSSAVVTPERQQGRARRAADSPQAISVAVLAVIVVLCAMLSIAISGHQSGANNNLFHLPILTQLYDQPHFAADPFVQSLRFYSSGVWMVLEGVADRQTMLDLFLPLQVLSRVLFFVGALMLAQSLDLADRRAQAVFLVIVAVAKPLYEMGSPAGGGGMLLNEFTHSELANATMLIALALAARNRFGWAVAVAGVTFFINMFMAVWLAVPLALLMAAALRNGEATLAALSRQLLLGGLASAPLVVLVLMNVVANPDFAAPLEFAYVAFLTDYWPDHFLIWETPTSELIKLGVILAAALAAGLSLPSRARRIALVSLAGFALVWLVGTAAPLVTSSPTVLNLHLLRSSAMIVSVSTLVIATLAASLFGAGKPADRTYFAPALVVILAGGYSLLPLVIVLLAVRAVWTPPALPWPRVPAFAALALVAALTIPRIGDALQLDRAFREGQREWMAIAEWARTQTAPGTRFLLPVGNSLNEASTLPRGMARAAELPLGGAIFTTWAERSVWVGIKEGAAVMWRPSLYPQWHERLVNLLVQDNLPELLTHARRIGVEIVIDVCSGSGGPTPAFRSGRLCAYRVGGAAR